MFSPYLALHDFGEDCFAQYELHLCSEQSFATGQLAAGRSEFKLLAEDICKRARAEEKTSLAHAVRSLLIDDILQDMAYCLWDKNYLAKLILLRQDAQARPVSLGIWCLPPVFQFDGMVFEYLMSCGVPVIGIQHGGLNGCQAHVEMMTPDLLRCTDYVTWGCTKEDLVRLFPRETLPCRIHPLGWVRPIRKNIKKHADFDLLFPLTCTLNMLDSAMVREKPELLLEKQIRLLDYLDGLSGVKVAVKPFPNANQWNCDLYDKLMTLRNVQVFWDISLVSFIEKYRFRGVLIEQPSTPIYEVLDLDVEIFLHLDSVLEIETPAFEELERRVYCFREIDPMIRAMNTFLAGELPELRDEQFYRHYVSRPATKENFLGLVDELQNNA